MHDKNIFSPKYGILNIKIVKKNQENVSYFGLEHFEFK